jgi:histone deacetylase complex regulatory component SIN3
MIVASNEINEVVGASTITFHNYPNDRVAFVTAVGGKFISDTDTYNQFKEILKGFGATKIQGAARKSIARLWRTKLGFKERHIIVEAKI